MKDIKEKLESEMSDMTFNEHVFNTFVELAYTAAEVGILPFKLREDAIDIIKLYKLAEKYEKIENLPKEYKL